MAAWASEVRKEQSRRKRGSELGPAEHPDRSPACQLLPDRRCGSSAGRWNRVWDIESCFKPVPVQTEVFNMNEDGSVNLVPGDLETTKMEKMAHIGNYVHCRNVFTDDEHEFENLEDFEKPEI